MMRKYSMLLTLCFVITASAGWLFTNGSGRIESENREVAQFTEVRIKGETYVTRADFEVFLTQDASHALVIEADDNILPMVKSEVRGGTLTIWNDEWFRSSNNVRIYISSPEFRKVHIDGLAEVKTQTPILSPRFEITINGSGRVDLNIDAETLDAIINGRGDIGLVGQTDRLRIQINGHGNIDALSLTSKSADVTINGAGDVALEALETLDIEINGIGKVLYIGSPDVKPSITGSGKIERIDE